MTFKPISKPHRQFFRHRRRPARLGSSWDSWTWRPERRNLYGFKNFDPRRRKGVLLILVLFLIGLFGTDQVMKAYAPVATGSITNIWDSNFPLDTISEYNNNHASVLTHATAPCNTALTDDTNADCIALAPTANNPAIALIKAGITDFSKAAGINILGQFNWILNGTPNPQVEFGWYLTLNATLPADATDAGYSPYDDPNVMIYFRITYTGSNNWDMELFLKRGNMLSQTIHQQDNGGTSGSGSRYLQVDNTFSSFTTAWSWALAYLNFTGPPAPNSSCNASTGFGSGCSSVQFGKVGGAVGTEFVALGTQNLAPFATNPTYYMGYFAGKGLGVNVVWAGDNNPPNHLANFWAVITPIVTTYVQAGFFGPLIMGLVQYAVSFFTGSVVVLEGFIAAVLNAIGTLFGDSNFGTHLIEHFNNFITFIGDANTGLIAAFNNFGNLFTVFYNGLKVTFPWLPIAISIALNLGTFFINGIAEFITLVSIAMTFFVGGFSFFLILLFFLYVGDDAIGGFLAWIETMEYLLLGIGVGWTTRIVNLGLDFFTFIIGAIPKPFIQMVAHRFPRLPILEVNARFIMPSLDFGEARSGNMLTYALWASGFDFLAWYESRNPALPGAIGALVPGAETGATVLNGMLPFFNLVVLLAWGAVVIWLGTMPFSLIGYDLAGTLPLTVGPGRQISGGPGKISFRKAEKRFQNVKKRIGKVKEPFKEAKTRVEQAKESVENIRLSQKMEKAELKMIAARRKQEEEE